MSLLRLSHLSMTFLHKPGLMFLHQMLYQIIMLMPSWGIVDTCNLLKSMLLIEQRRLKAERIELDEGAFLSLAILSISCNNLEP